MNETIFFIKDYLCFNNLSVQTVIDCQADGINLNTKQNNLNGVAVKDAVLLQNRKLSQICSVLVSRYPTLKHQPIKKFPYVMFQTINNKVNANFKRQNHAYYLPLLLNVP